MNVCYQIIILLLRKYRKPIWLVGVGAVVVTALFVVGSLRHDRSHNVVRAAALPIVKVAPPQVTEPVLLVGTLTALSEAVVYAPITGIVKRRLHEAGDRLNKGDLLAEIEAPNNDREVRQARSTLALAEEETARAKQELENARMSEDQGRAALERYKALFELGAVSREEIDRIRESLRGATASTGVAQGNLTAAEQNLEAQRANLNRLTGREPFAFVRAPFSGAITSRNCEAGAAVEAGSELFRMADIGTLRIIVNAASIRAGQRATVLVPEIPAATFSAKVVRATDSEVEVEVPNPDRKLLPGMHAQVRMESAAGTH